VSAYCIDEAATEVGLHKIGAFNRLFARRIVGYLAGAAAATLIYVIWDVCVTHLSVAPRGRPSIMFEIGLAIFFAIFEGFGAAMLLIAPLWFLVTLSRNLAPRLRALYFSAMGAALTFLAACAMSSLAPKPLFIEDQTFFEGFRIAVERQGVVFLVAGAVFGCVYWLVGERSLPVCTTQSD
jgi:hypothetical protein